jgi:thimet oligopeptidase
MYRFIGFIFSSIFVVHFAVGCCGAAPPPPSEPPPDLFGDPEPVADGEPAPVIWTAPSIWQTVSDVATGCQAHLDAARAIRDELVVAKAVRTRPNTLDPLNDLFIELDRVLPLAELITNVSPDKAVRTAAETCQQDVMKFIAKLQLDRAVYDALAAVELAGFDAATRRFAEDLRRDYRRSGVDQDEATRKELEALIDEMVKTGQAFSRTIRESKHSIEVTKSDLAGLPQDFIEAHIKDGKGQVTTDYPDFFPVVTYADSEEIRQALYLKFFTRAYPENEANLKKLLTLRHSYATKLGYSDWAAYVAEEQMVKTKETIADFIDKVADISRPRMERDRSALLARKKKAAKRGVEVRVWDRFYYVNKVRIEEYGVDAEVVRAYFDYPRVKQGLLDINQEIFGVVFKKVDDAEVWHESVDVYEVLDGAEVIGRFYLDMHPRDGKYGHAAMFNLLSGVTGRQLPSAGLVCNFPAPSDKGPALMEFDDVGTFFHEFGHLMHHLLAGRHEWVTQSGIACEHDFVEVPSQLLEEWAWDPAVLKRFAVHHETGEPIPEALVAKMRKSDEFGQGLHVLRQMFYAGLSLDYHDSDPAGIDLLEVVQRNQKTYSPYPYEPGTYVFANFGHLAGYSSQYYTYMWSLMLAKDMFTKFDQADLMNQAVLKAYRDKIIAPGGSRDAADMVKDFLGRDYSFDALKTYLESE